MKRKIQEIDNIINDVMGYGLTYKQQFNKKFKFDKNQSHTLDEISKLSKYKKRGLETIYRKGVGAYHTNPESVRPQVHSPEQWAMARVYASINPKSKASKVDKKHLISGGKINFHKIHWGAFTKQFNNRKNKRIKNFKEYSNYILKHPNEFNKITRKRANFYKNFIFGRGINGGMLKSDDMKTADEWINDFPEFFESGMDMFQIRDLLNNQASESKEERKDLLEHKDVPDEKSVHSNISEILKDFKEASKKYNPTSIEEMKKEYYGRHEDDNFSISSNEDEDEEEIDIKDIATKIDLDEEDKNIFQQFNEIINDIEFLEQSGEYEASKESMGEQMENLIENDPEIKKLEKKINALKKESSKKPHIDEKNKIIKTIKTNFTRSLNKKFKPYLDKLKILNDLQKEIDKLFNKVMTKTSYNSKKDIKLAQNFIKDNKEYIIKEFDIIGNKIQRELIEKVNSNKDMIFDYEPISIPKENTTLLKEAVNPKNAENVIIDFVDKNPDFKYSKVENEEAINKLANESGQALELSCCGENNKIGSRMLGVKKTNINFTEFFLYKIHQKVMKTILKRNPKFEADPMASQSPQDNVDIKNRKVLEMKDFSNSKNNGKSAINFFNTKREANIKMKQAYLIKLKLEFDLEIEKIHNNISINNEKFEELSNLLSNQTSFERNFYSTQPYYGHPIQIAKFNPPKLSDKKSENNKLIDLSTIISGFHPRCESNFRKKKIYHYKSQTRKGKNEDDRLYNKLMTDEINKECNLNGDENNDLSFEIFYAYKDTLAKYDYTNDDCIEGDNVMGTYTFSLNRKGNAYKNYNIPVDKFLLF